MHTRLPLLLLLLCTSLLTSCVKQADHDALKAENAQLKSQISDLTAQLDAHTQMPVTMTTRDAWTGPGLVAVFSTTIKQPVPVLVTVKSAALGTTKTFELAIDPDSGTNLGHKEGAILNPGDTITLSNQLYHPITWTLP